MGLASFWVHVDWGSCLHGCGADTPKRKLECSDRTNVTIISQISIPHALGECAAAE